jgi:hypothetical protein
LQAVAQGTEELRDNAVTHGMTHLCQRGSEVAR